MRLLITGWRVEAGKMFETPAASADTIMLEDEGLAEGIAAEVLRAILPALAGLAVPDATRADAPPNRDEPDDEAPGGVETPPPSPQGDSAACDGCGLWTLLPGVGAARGKPELTADGLCPDCLADNESSRRRKAKRDAALPHHPPQRTTTP